jgi:hypothetical protein
LVLDAWVCRARLLRLLAGRLTGLLGHDLAWLLVDHLPGLLDHGLTRLLGLNHGLLVAREHHSICSLVNDAHDVLGHVLALGSILPQAPEGMYIDDDPDQNPEDRGVPIPPFEEEREAEKEERGGPPADLSSNEQNRPDLNQGAARLAEGCHPHQSGNTLRQAENSRVAISRCHPWLAW